MCISCNCWQVICQCCIGWLWFCDSKNERLCCSEEKAKLLRRVGGIVDEKDQELITFMASLQLDRLNIYSEPDRLPQVMPSNELGFQGVNIHATVP